jgi:hypothetical protein
MSWRRSGGIRRPPVAIHIPFKRVGMPGNARRSRFRARRRREQIFNQRTVTTGPTRVRSRWSTFGAEYRARGRRPIAREGRDSLQSTQSESRKSSERVSLHRLRNHEELRMRTGVGLRFSLIRLSIRVLWPVTNIGNLAAKTLYS